MVASRWPWRLDFLAAAINRSISAVVRYSRVRTEEFTVVGANRPPVRFPTIFCPRSKPTVAVSLVTSDAGLLAYRELDDALGLTEMASDVLADARTGKNGRYALAGLFRQSVFGRLAGIVVVMDAERLGHDPAMRWIVGG